MNVYETLVTINSDVEPEPMLAESIEESEDSKTYTFKLREGVKFHNGEEMTSDDVVASMNRWKDQADTAKSAFEDAEFIADDEYTVKLKLEEPRSDTLSLLSQQNQFPAIMPEEVIDNASKEGVEEYVGTGPFEIDNWKRDEEIHLQRFEDYSPEDSDSNGLAGKKEALVDDLYFQIVTDPSTQISGLESGEYDIAFGVPFDSYEQLESAPNINVENAFFGTMALDYNKKDGPFTDYKLREAVNVALEADDIMFGAFSDDDLYKLESSYMPEGTWYSNAGEDTYNIGDKEEAKNLLEESEYDGEELNLLTSRDIKYHYDIAVIIQQQLKDIGMNVDVVEHDWATYLDKREEPSEWDLLTVGLSYNNSPSQLLVLGTNYVGWTSDNYISDQMNSITTSESEEEAKDKWDELQEYAWEEYLPVTQLGSVPIIVGMSDDVNGLKVENRPIMMPMWNVEIEE